MVFGIISAILFLFICFKFVTKRCKWERTDSIFLKIHKYCAIALLLLVLIHFFTSLSLVRTRPILLYILGIIACLLIISILITSVFRSRLKRNWLFLHRFQALLLAGVIVAHVVVSITSLADYKKRVKEIVIQEVDLKALKNGTYYGSCDVGYIFAKVKVSVKNGKIEDIKIVEHRNERGESAKQITKEMIQQQKINVDAISGATNSSMAIKKAVENALHNK